MPTHTLIHLTHINASLNENMREKVKQTPQCFLSNLDQTKMKLSVQTCFNVSIWRAHDRL